MPSPNEESIDRARRGLAVWMGAEPNATLTVAGPTGGPSIAILTFVDEDDDAGPDGRTTFLATAGLHRRELKGRKGGAEMVVCMAGDFDADERAELAEQLGEIAVALVSGEGDFEPGARIATPPLPVFEDMTVLLLARWGQEGESLEETDPPIWLFSANPLYEDEAEAIDGMNEEEALAWIDEQEIEIDDPLRAPAVVAPPPVFTEALAALASGRSFDITQAIQDVAKNMESWIRENAPQLEATQQVIDAEAEKAAEKAPEDAAKSNEKPPT